jgi:hypothetical protein
MGGKMIAAQCDAMSSCPALRPASSPGSWPGVSWRAKADHHWNATPTAAKLALA